MIRGVINKNRPLIPIVIGWTFGVQEMVALLDTGFTGELKISPAKATELGLEITHTEKVGLGDNSTVDMLASIAIASMEDSRNVVSVLISGGDPVVGVGLLRRFGYILMADFKAKYLTLQK